jgi:hypothetical protein
MSKFRSILRLFVLKLILALSMACIITFCYLPKNSIAQTMNGFKDIVFGTKYSAVRSDLQYIAKNPDDLILGREGSRYLDITKLWNYEIGGKKYLIEFFFDHRDRFYYFDITWPHAMTANYLNSVMKEDLDFLTDIFRKKYGNPSHCNSFPSVLEIKLDRISTYCEWETEEGKALTGINETEEGFFTIARVLDKKLFTEYTEIEDAKQSDKATQGAMDF